MTVIWTNAMVVLTIIHSFRTKIIPTVTGFFRVMVSVSFITHRTDAGRWAIAQEYGRCIQWFVRISWTIVTCILTRSYVQFNVLIGTARLSRRNCKFTRATFPFIFIQLNLNNVTCYTADPIPVNFQPFVGGIRSVPY